MRAVTPETKVWATSLYWRDCDPFISVVGFDKKEVRDRAAQIAKNELNDAVDTEMINAESDAVQEADVRAELAGQLCGGEVFEYSVSDFILDSDAEHLRELAEDGLTVL